MDMNTQPAGN